MTTVDYETIWEDTWGDMQRYGPIHRHHRRIFSELLRRIPRGEIATIADVGCGEGSNLYHLSREFPQARLFGFDVSRTAIRRARATVSAEFAILDVQTSSVDRQFDLVISSDVIEHIPDDQGALRNMYRMTGKYALIATVQGRMREFERSIGHIRSYDYGELQRKMHAAGYTVLETVEWGFPLYSPLYRDLFNLSPQAEQTSHGSYSPAKRLLCQLLYGLFALNSARRGDIIFVLARR